MSPLEVLVGLLAFLTRVSGQSVGRCLFQAVFSFPVLQTEFTLIPDQATKLERSLSRLSISDSFRLKVADSSILKWTLLLPVEDNMHPRVRISRQAVLTKTVSPFDREKKGKMIKRLA